MDINSRNLGQQEEDLDKKKFRKRASMSRSTAGVCESSLVVCAHKHVAMIVGAS